MPRRPVRRAVSADDLYQLRFVSDPQLSPDGTQVVYVCAWVDPEDRTRYRSQIMLVPFDGSSPPRPLTSGKHRDNAPRWSPDNCSIAFVSDRDNDRGQVFILPLQGGEPRQVTSLKRGAGAPVWSPNGDRIAFAARTDIAEVAQQEGQSEEKGKSPRVRIVTRVHYKADGEGLTEALHRHLFVVDAANGSEPKQLTDGDWDDAEPTWSPDGESIAFTSGRERDRDLSMLNDVWLVPSSGGRARRVTRHKGEVGSPVFSPDGRQIAFLGHEKGKTYGAAHRPDGHLVRGWRVDLDSWRGWTRRWATWRSRTRATRSRRNRRAGCPMARACWPRSARSAGLGRAFCLAR